MSDQLERLSQRLQHLEDLEAIRHSWRDYCIRLDSKDWPGLADVYTTDATLEMRGLASLGDGLDGVFRGRQSIIEDFYKPAMAGVYDIPAGIFTTGHISTNMQIEHLGDAATTLAYFFEIVANDLILIGTYQHRMVREAERWRFHRLHITVRYHARLEVNEIGGSALTDILARPV